MHCRYTRAMRCLFIFGILFFSATNARGHPEDELCVPGRDNIDPVVCAMLAEMNRSNGDFLLEENAYQIESIATKTSSISILSTYIAIGMDHILLGGYDHMLFVIALFLASLRLGSLVWQILADIRFHDSSHNHARPGGQRNDQSIRRDHRTSHCFHHCVRSYREPIRARHH